MGTNQSVQLADTALLAGEDTAQSGGLGEATAAGSAPPSSTAPAPAAAATPQEASQAAASQAAAAQAAAAQAAAAQAAAAQAAAAQAAAAQAAAAQAAGDQTGATGEAADGMQDDTSGYGPGAWTPLAPDSTIGMSQAVPSGRGYFVPAGPAFASPADIVQNPALATLFPGSLSGTAALLPSSAVTPRPTTVREGPMNAYPEGRALVPGAFSAPGVPYVGAPIAGTNIPGVLQGAGQVVQTAGGPVWEGAPAPAAPWYAGSTIDVPGATPAVFAPGGHLYMGPPLVADRPLAGVPLALDAPGMHVTEVNGVLHVMHDSAEEEATRPRMVYDWRQAGWSHAEGLQVHGTGEVHPAAPVHQLLPPHLRPLGAQSAAEPAVLAGEAASPPTAQQTAAGPSGHGGAPAAAASAGSFMGAPLASGEDVARVLASGERALLVIVRMGCPYCTHLVASVSAALTAAPPQHKANIMFISLPTAVALGSGTLPGYRGDAPTVYMLAGGGATLVADGSGPEQVAAVAAAVRSFDVPAAAGAGGGAGAASYYPHGEYMGMPLMSADEVRRVVASGQEAVVIVVAKGCGWCGRLLEGMGAELEAAPPVRQVALLLITGDVAGGLQDILHDFSGATPAVYHGHSGAVRKAVEGGGPQQAKQAAALVRGSA